MADVEKIVSEYDKPETLVRLLAYKIISPVCRFLPHVTWRFGRPFLTTTEDVQAVERLAKPGMVMVSKINYQLTNLLIGGFWDHATIIGPKGEVIEATSAGVTSCSIAEFVRTHDYILLLKPAFASEARMREASNFAATQLGMPYDFRFAFRLTDNKSFYCSELPWWAYEKTYKYVDAHSPFIPRLVFGQYTVLAQDFADATQKFEHVYTNRLTDHRT